MLSGIAAQAFRGKWRLYYYCYYYYYYYYYLIQLQMDFYPVDRLCGLVVRVPGYRTEMYCASCEVRTEFMYVM
jgi:hypothetical protein